MLSQRYLLTIPLLAVGLLIALVLLGAAPTSSQPAPPPEVPVAQSVPPVTANDDAPPAAGTPPDERLAFTDVRSEGNRRGGPTYDNHTSDVAGRPPVISHYLAVPYRSQFDGTTYEDGNCGPAALGMVMSYYAESASSDSIRRDVNRYLGYWGLDGGSSWDSLSYAAAKRGFAVAGLRQGKSFRRWTIDELVAEAGNGRPPILLVRYRMLPGHEQATFAGLHYIVFLGLTADGDVLYHDSAFKGDSFGAYRTMSKAQLMRAWGSTGADSPYSAMVVYPQRGSLP